MRWTSHGVRQPTCLFEAAVFHCAVMPVCACGHAACFAPHGLWWHFHRRQWDDRFGEARRRFWCRRCRAALGRKIAPLRIEAPHLTAEAIALPPPDERAWRRAVSRHRA
ncbi:MAG: hypothetical protein KGM17_03675 [Sphingomonadales bacterium]|nr:hypothetical protein [Sphingomonadales bacterium]